MPKIVPKSIQTCFGRVWGKLSENFCPVFHGMSSLQKFSKKNIFKIPKMPKSVPKRIQTCFRVIFLKKFNAQCSMEGRVFENFQNFVFKIPKRPKIVPKSIQTCFERVLGQTFRKFFAQFSTGFRILEKFQKNQKNIFKFPKKPKIVPESIQTCFERVLGQIFRKFFCSVFRGGSSFRKISKFFFKNSKNAQKCSQKYPNVF